MNHDNAAPLRVGACLRILRDQKHKTSFRDASVSRRTHTPVSIFFIVVLPCAVLVLENLRTTRGMDQHTPQFLIATRPHLKIVVTCSKQSLVAFSNGNNNPCGAIRLSLVPTTNLITPEARR